MPWLVRDGQVLASLEVVDSGRGRYRSGIDGAILLRRCRTVHTLGMRFAVDVAYCDDDLIVVRKVRMARHRIGRPCLKASQVIEAEAGAFDRWGLEVGDQLDVKG
jgi:uncharacterized protein